ncbi:MAG: hypothetical protein H8D23_21280 [Candidatus Brocadiales bacterium]|nr:hypothetical protein [Candidatus Brocadiales bacterium]
MKIQPDFVDVWNSIEDFVLSDKGPEYCVYAREFLDWVTELCEEVANSPNIVSVNQSKVI